MPFSTASRWFLTAALAHLAVVGALLLLSPDRDGLSLHWDLLLWLLLTGFVGLTTAGLSLHLFPTISRHPLPAPGIGRVAFLLAESGVLLGAVGLSGERMPWQPGWTFTLGACLLLAGVGTVLLALSAGLTQPRFRAPGPEARPGDVATVPLFLGSWVSAVGAALLFVLSGLGPGPGFGWWIAAVHLFVLGHAILLVAAVSLRLLPRSVSVDVPRGATFALTGLAVAGAVTVPCGMLVTSPQAARDLIYCGVPEALFALGLVGAFLFLVGRSRAVRLDLVFQGTSLSLLLVGGGLGLWIVSESSYSLVVPHAVVNVLGFLGLMVLVEWFGMIAPFQRISHRWTRRMLGLLGGAWLVGVLAAALGGAGNPAAPGWLYPVAGALIAGVAIAWGAGTIPVLYPQVHPLPGLSSDRIRSLRERWRDR